MPALAADPTIRRQVMSAAREVLSEDAAAPVAAIADRAGVSRATFYRHFGSRDSLLASIKVERRPDARTRILVAAKDMLVRTSLAELSMDDLAKAAGVSRGSLYRVVPGKGALLQELIEAYSPFEAVRAIIRDHADDPPALVFPRIGREIVGLAGERLGLMRAIFVEVTSGGPAVAEMGPLFEQTLGLLAQYIGGQMAAGRIRPMHPLLALQAFVGPIFFHLMTRPMVDRIVPWQTDPEAAVDQLVAAALEGLIARPAA